MIDIEIDLWDISMRLSVEIDVSGCLLGAVVGCLLSKVEG